MKAKGKFITTLLVINAAFGGYALGLNSRHVAVVDSSLPPYVAPKTSGDSAAHDSAKTPQTESAKDKKDSKAAHETKKTDTAKSAKKSEESKHKKKSDSKHASDAKHGSDSKHPSDSNHRSESKPKSDSK